MKRSDKIVTSRILIILAFMIMVSLAMYLIAYKPILQRIAKVKDEIASVQQKIESMQRKNQEMAELTHKQREGFRQYRITLNKKAPSSIEVSKLLADFSELAATCGVYSLVYDYSSHSSTISSNLAARGYKPNPLRAGQSQQTGNFRAVSIPVNTSSDYRALIRFIDSLNSLERLVTIDELSIRRNAPLVDASLVIKAYSSVE